MQNNKVHLIYGYDSLCGWCYGLIPALRALEETYPDIIIEVVPGGLFTGDRVHSYHSLVDHITRAFPRVTETTGQAPSDGFWDLITRSNAPLANSTIPNMAVLLMNEIAPERTLEYVHRLMEVHFIDAMDLNVAETYETLSKKYGFPMLDTSIILNASDNDELIAKSYMRSTALGINSYPSMLIVDNNDKVLQRLPSVYDPIEFVDVCVTAMNDILKL